MVNIENLPWWNNNMENWIEDLKKRSKNRTEMWMNDLPSGTWTWYYDDGQKESELKFDKEYPVELHLGTRMKRKKKKKKKKGRYKDFFPREEGWTIWSKDGRVIFGESVESWNPLIAGYTAFVAGYVCTTLINLWM